MSEAITAETVPEQDGQHIAELREWVQTTHGVTDPGVQDEIIAGIASAYLSGNGSSVESTGDLFDSNVGGSQ